MNWYYDNASQPYSGDSDHVAFDRIYCIDFDSFSQEDWVELARIYGNLPGTQYEKDVPYWYGMNENNPPFLAVSVEPPGLQVAGVLPLSDWAEWHEMFRKQVEASSLPICEI